MVLAWYYLYVISVEQPTGYDHYDYYTITIMIMIRITTIVISVQSVGFKAIGGETYNEPSRSQPYIILPK